jgi:hypothetical protein
MANCGKHFPGHGHAQADSHVAAPVDKRSRRAILADDAQPYAWLGGTLSSVMPAHVTYPKVDARPAGFSRVWLQDILRGELGFSGAIFSDDLSMEGARVIDGRAVSPSAAAIEALHAGCDLVLLCNQSKVDGGAPVDALLDELAAAQGRGHWRPDPASEARRVALLPQTDPLPWDELMHAPAYQHALGGWLSDPSADAPRPPPSACLQMISPAGGRVGLTICVRSTAAPSSRETANVGELARSLFTINEREEPAPAAADHRGRHALTRTRVSTSQTRSFSRWSAGRCLDRYGTTCCCRVDAEALDSSRRCTPAARSASC